MKKEKVKLICLVLIKIISKFLVAVFLHFSFQSEVLDICLHSFPHLFLRQRAQRLELLSPLRPWQQMAELGGSVGLEYLRHTSSCEHLKLCKGARYRCLKCQAGPTFEGPILSNSRHDLQR